MMREGLSRRRYTCSIHNKLISHSLTTKYIVILAKEFLCEKSCEQNPTSRRSAYLVMVKGV